ncbi:MAG: SH3 domain-containing protein [Pseudomonadota bacterium]
MNRLLPFMMALGVMAAAAGVASAHDWRNHFALELTQRVVGVESWDVLNMRSGPGVRYQIVGELEPGAAPITILDCVHPPRWCKVRGPFGQSGWVNMRYIGGTAY